MKKLALSIALACSLMVFLQAVSQAQTFDANAHKAVASQANSANGTTATKSQVWKTNMDAAKAVEGAIGTLRQTVEGGAKTKLPKDFHYNIKDWTQQDITNFATCSETYDFFETLLGITNAALKKDKAGKFTEDAAEAQAALAYLKPETCKSWVGFAKMIATASGETETLRAQYHQGIGARKYGIR